MATVYYDTAAGGAGTGADWTNAFTTFAAAITGAGSGGTIYVASSSNEVQGSATTWSCGSTVGSPLKVYSVNKAGSVPPVAADLTAGAILSTNVSGGTITITGNGYFNGVTVNASIGQSAAGGIILGNGGGQSLVFENGKLIMSTTFNTGTMATGSANHITVILRNTTLKFSATGQKFNVNSGRLYWCDTASAIDTGGTVPNILFNTGVTGIHVLERLDFSALTLASQLFGATSVTNSAVFMKDCKLGSGASIGQWLSIDGGYGFMARSGSSTSFDNAVVGLDGAMFHGQSLVTARVGGAAYDGSTAFSWQIVPTSNNHIYHRPKTPDIEVYNTLTGGSHTVTMYGMANKSTMPTNADVWLEAAYLGDSGSPLKTTVSSGLATILTTASNQSADTSDWTAGTVAARANSTPYNVGDRIKLASNPGRVFTCTVGGTSTSPEPGGYATAVDGGAVTDGGATFRASWRFAMTVTLGTIDRAGLIIAWARFGAATSTDSYWLDPDVAVA